MTLQPTACNVLPFLPQDGRISCIAAPFLGVSLHAQHTSVLGWG